MPDYIKKYKELSLPVKAAMWFTICSIIQKGISFITVPIFTRMLTVEEYGVYSVYNSWLSLFTIVATLKMYSGCYFKGLYKYKDNKEDFTCSIQTEGSLITIIFFVIIAFFYEKIHPLIGLSAELFIMMALRIFFTPSIELWMTEQRVRYNYQGLVVLTIGIAIFNPLLGIIAILCTKAHHAEMRVLGGLIVYIVCGLVFYIRNIIRSRRLYNREYWKYAIHYDLPLLPHNLALSVLGQSDRIMINFIAGAEKAAIYSLAYSVSMTLQIVKDAIRDAILPWIYTKLEERSYKEIRGVVNILLFLVSLISFIFIAFAPEVVMVMGSRAYYEAIWIMPPVAISLYFMFLYNIFSSVEFYYEKTKYAMVASVISAVLNIILNFICIDIWGYIAAGYTTLFCYVGLSIAHYIMAHHVLTKEGEPFELIDKGFVLIYSILVIGFACVFSVVYRYTIIRLLLVAFMLFFVFVMKKRFIDLFNEFRMARKVRKRRE